ncbi:small secreted protein [Streptomyces spectabilis]|uniref:Small secreted protein n=1 Tax=Streptomyces spectabilis TaxID=68270 RepID=A0A516RB31_STRST|nr:small secreted protein [Streptomyces spectabilis]QDQ12854.1 small secreted protein [Streptomyces spectabilis]
MEGTNPVNKKLAAVLSGGAVLVLALSGCSDDDGNKKLDDWAKKVCDTAVQAQSKKIADANAAIKKQTADNSSPEEVKKTDSQAFQDISDAYKDRSAALKKAGAPPVDDGEKKLNAAVKELDGLSKSYADLKAQTDKLDTKNQSAFADDLAKVAEELGKLSKSENTAQKQLEAGDVGKAMRDQDSCKAGSSPSAS